jgi:hypothetical protein
MEDDIECETEKCASCLRAIEKSLELCSTCVSCDLSLCDACALEKNHFCNGCISSWQPDDGECNIATVLLNHLVSSLQLSLADVKSSCMSKSPLTPPTKWQATNAKTQCKKKTKKRTTNDRDAEYATTKPMTNRRKILHCIRKSSAGSTPK